MAVFSRLKLSGFKSFVDSQEIAIERGLTGIVGPNGCGKSNLVEALRWVMGESSARQMRGGEMEDVIFSGSAHRPRRDVAEVSLVLDNGAGALPPPFDQASEIEVSRRIGRGDGSSYRVNGREVRARDVQTLFADLSSGARATAIVGQGNIAAIISARPSERRLLLEEAAGISGLYARRREAESRLKAADANLERLSDMEGALVRQQADLKKQARHAERYRALALKIRETETRILAAAWREARGRLAEAAQKSAETEAGLRGLGAAVEEAEAGLAQMAAALPLLRDGFFAASEQAQRLRQESALLAAEEDRLRAARQEAAQKIERLAVDFGREEERVRDAKEALAGQEKERLGLIEQDALAAAQLSEAEQAEARARIEVEGMEAALAEMIARIAAADAEQGAALKSLSEAEDRLEKTRARLEATARECAALEKELPDRALLTSAEMELEEAEEHLALCQEAAKAAGREKPALLSACDQTRESLQRARASLAALEAEASGLGAALRDQTGETPGALIDALSVSPGHEAALGAAFGEDLSAPLDQPLAARSWRELREAGGGDAPLPKEATPLSDLVSAPLALRRRLSQTGLVGDEAAGAALQPLLACGQVLVTVAGDVWRWDGFVQKAGAPSPAAAHLRQRARLRTLAAMIEDEGHGVAAAAQAAGEATARLEEQAGRERAANDRAMRAAHEREALAAAHQKLARKEQAGRERLGALEERRQGLDEERREAAEALERARDRVRAFPAAHEGRARLAEMRAETGERRLAALAAAGVLERLKSERAERGRRLAALGREGASWEKRLEAGLSHLEEMTARKEQAQAEMAALESAPQRIEDRRADLRARLETAEAAAMEARAALTQGEERSAAAERLFREAERALGAAREEMVRREAAREQCEAAFVEAGERLAEKLGIRRERINPDDRQETEAVGALADRLRKLQQDREALGPVNLMAEKAMAEIGERLASLRAESDDLKAAIMKLRSAIGSLNREGRERLLASFEQVNQGFGVLFSRLFGGGRAHLGLVDSADPLQAGLEIMASPPGKRLQSLSLLSGGEQALTALALLFAVFAGNPAPICVLDEVDAPLDDANVDRFCSLLEEMTERTGTRFLVITHHRMTMARMDRLYGVTMAERGVSTLVSVNLGDAGDAREARRS